MTGVLVIKGKFGDMHREETAHEGRGSDQSDVAVGQARNRDCPQPPETRKEMGLR